MVLPHLDATFTTKNAPGLGASFESWAVWPESSLKGNSKSEEGMVVGFDRLSGSAGGEKGDRLFYSASCECE